MTEKMHNFSLIELLIVVGILGALAGLIMPAFNGVDEDAKDKVALTEMKEIQRQFQQFYADVIGEARAKNSYGTDNKLTNYYLQDIAWYGLWPLLVPNHPHRTEQAVWPAAGDIKPEGAFKRYEQYGAMVDGEALTFGWHGPYLEYEGIVSIEAPSLTYQYTEKKGSLVPSENHKGGQTRSATSDIKIPVLKDPYGGYYRVLCPEERAKSSNANDGGNALGEYDRLKRMVIVCTGRNRKLETRTDSFIPGTDKDYVKSINGDDLKAQGDDIVLRLLPAAF